MKILLTGRTGQVGWELERALPALGEVIATDRSTLDLADLDAIRRVVREAKPDLIVNAAAYTAVDRAESEPVVATQINSIAPGVLAQEVKRLGALLVHFSTDYVFDGSKRSPYAESDRPNPLGIYGRTKLEGEQAVRSSGCRSLVLRTSWVYSNRGRNFMLAILKKARETGQVRVVSDQIGAPTPAEVVARGTVAAIRSAASAGFDGLYHFAAQGETSWHGFAGAILRASGVPAEAVPIETREYPSDAARPSYSVLDSRRFIGVFRFEPPHWEAALSRLLTHRSSDRS